MARQIVTEIIGSSKEFTKAVGEANASADGFGSKMASVAKAGALAFLAIGSAAAVFGIEAVRHTTEVGQAAYESSEKFGILPGVASQWMSVASQLGLSGDTVMAGFQKMDKSVGALAISQAAGIKWTQAQVEPFQVLGLAITDTHGKIKSANELMLESADVFSKMPDGVEKTALAMKVFGKTGADMLPILNQGRAGIQAFIDKGTQMGDVMSGPQVEAAHKLALEQAKLKTAMDGVTVQIGEFLMPVIVAFMGFVVSNAIPAIQRLGSWFMEHLQPALQQVWAAATQLGEVLKSFLMPLFDYIGDHINTLKPILIAIGILFAVVFGAVILIIIAAVVAVTAIVAAIVWFAGRTEEILGTAHGYWDSFIGFIKSVPGTITGALSGMWNFLQDEFRLVANRIIGVVNQLIAAFNMVPHFGLPSLPSIPTMDMGGVVPGPPGSRQIVAALGGEHFGGAQSIGGGRPELHIHIDQGAYIDGPSVDRLANLILQRSRYAPGT